LLNSGEQYKLSFWAKTDNISGEINLAIINSSNFFVYYGKTFELTNDWTEYEINYTAITTAPVAINIDLGIQTGVYYLDNFLFTTPALLNANQIRNADFFDGDTYWNFTTLSLAQANDTVIAGEFMISITEGGNDVWDIHLGQSDINIENGKEYVVTFDAYAEAPRTISSITGKNSEPWTAYNGSHIFSLTTEKETYSYSFIMSNQTDSQSRFGFDIGASTSDVFFDNIMVGSGTTPVSLIPDLSAIPESIRLFQNYPNPFSSITTIRYSLDKTSSVKIIIYNLLGNEVLELLNEQQIEGNHSVTWDGKNKLNEHLGPGIYYYQFITDKFRLTKKMLLLK